MTYTFKVTGPPIVNESTTTGRIAAPAGTPGALSGLVFPSGVYGQNNPTKTRAFATARGKALDLLAYFPSRETWAALKGSWWFTMSEYFPQEFTGNVQIGMPLFPDNGNLDTAAAGGYNTDWREWATSVKTRFPNAYVRPGWEMNITNWGWSPRDAAGAAKFKTAFQHAVTSIRAVAPGMRIIFCPNLGAGNTGVVNAMDCYPGDGFVDLFGLDAYDWDAPYTSDAACATHKTATYEWDWWLSQAKTRGKKLALCEWGLYPGSPNSGGDNPRYVRFVYEWLRANAAHIEFETYFQEEADYISSDLFAGRNPLASAEYKRQMGLMTA